MKGQNWMNGERRGRRLKGDAAKPGQPRILIGSMMVYVKAIQKLDTGQFIHHDDLFENCSFFRPVHPRSLKQSLIKTRITLLSLILCCCCSSSRLQKLPLDTSWRNQEDVLEAIAKLSLELREFGLCTKGAMLLLEININHAQGLFLRAEASFLSGARDRATILYF